MKACPQCGHVNDTAVQTCDMCGYNFTTGAAGTKIPRILADESNIKRTGPSAGGSGGKAVGIAIAVVALLIAGAGGLLAVNFASEDQGSFESFEDSFEIDIPNAGKIEIPTDFDDGPTFTKASCTAKVGDAVAKLLTWQAKSKPINDLFARYTRFGPASFEYKTLVKFYADFDAQLELANGNREEAIALARKNVAKACAEHYGS